MDLVWPILPMQKNLQLTAPHILPYLNKGTPIRHHGYFPGFEFGNSSHEQAEKALLLHKQAVDTMIGLGEQVMTIHIGLVPTIPLDPDHTEKNLCKLVEYADKKGVTISLENLRRGPTSNPEYVVELAQKSGSAITLDVGHAVSSDLVCSQKTSVPEIIDMFSFALKEVHFYEYETDTHYPPKDLSVLAPVIDGLLKTECTWWTIELMDYSDILFTSELVKDYILEKSSLSVTA